MILWLRSWKGEIETSIYSGNQQLKRIDIEYENVAIRNVKGSSSVQQYIIRSINFGCTIGVGSLHTLTRIF